MTIPSILNYQGNKSSLIPFLKKNIEKYLEPGEIFFDIFSGSGSVGASFQQENIIFSNDAELYSTIISSSLLNTPEETLLQEIADQFQTQLKKNINKNSIEYIDYIKQEREFLLSQDNDKLINLYKNFPTIWNKLRGVTVNKLRKQRKYNLFTHYYSGTYFGIEQSIIIDSVIETIHSFQNESVTDTLYSCLFFAMKEIVFAKDGHMAQPLNPSKNITRHFKQRSKNLIDLLNKKLEEFILYSSKKVSNNQFQHQIYNLDIREITNNNLLANSNIKMIYADPPYTDMQYSRYYHLLNVAARYDFPEPTINHGKYTSGLYTEVKKVRPRIELKSYAYTVKKII